MIWDWNSFFYGLGIGLVVGSLMVALPLVLSRNR